MEKIYGQFDIETIEKLADIVGNKELSELTLTDGDKSPNCTDFHSLLLSCSVSFP